jgi:hypothetical protein
MFDELKKQFWMYFWMGRNLVGQRRRGAMDPRIGLGLAATFITAFIAMMVVATVEPETATSISQNSSLYQPYQTFTGYVGKSFSMWGLAIFVSVLGLVIGAIYAFWKS